jgi:L-seryl-tRNA(Ser) seleniumtransferase
MRVGKMTLAALAATLRLYRDVEQAEQSVPILRMLSMPVENLKLRAEKIATQLASTSEIGEAVAVESHSMLGGGSLPTQQIPTWCVSIVPAEGSLASLAQRLRAATPAIMGRIHKDRLLLDMRTVQPSQDLQLMDAVAALESSE